MRHITNKSSPQCRRNRSGLTLLEVLLSLTIFLASIATVSQLISTGLRAATQSRLQTQCIMHCESKMSEVVAGAEVMESTSEIAFENDESWLWQLEVVEGPHIDSVELIVTVTYAEESPIVPIQYELRRFVYVPPEEEIEEDSTL